MMILADAAFEIKTTNVLFCSFDIDLQQLRNRVFTFLTISE